jgi:hypothetical protein
LTDRQTAELAEVAVDNDVLIKGACYGLTTQLWATRLPGVLGAARFVVPGRIARMKLAGDPAIAQATALELIERSRLLEPTADELHLAAALETAAQRRGLALDAGESQLAAMVAKREIPLLETGDKRAIRGFEALFDELEALTVLHGRLRCLEQVVLRYADAGDQDAMARAICAEPEVDKTLTICFRCLSPPPHGTELDRQCLDSYIGALRADAPRALEP